MSQEVTSLKNAWEAYLAADARGIRSAYLEALGKFLDLWESSSPSTQEVEMPGFPGTLTEPGRLVQLRGPLLERVVVPTLLRDFRAGSAQAAAALARLRKSTLGSHRCWERFEVPNVVALLEEALRREPTCEAARTELVKCHLEYVRYTLHELPVGVLYGSDGASSNECEDLQELLEELRRLMRPSELEQDRELLESASFHYRMYSRYLLRQERSGYAKYLDENGGFEDPGTD